MFKGDFFAQNSQNRGDYWRTICAKFLVFGERILVASCDEWNEDGAADQNWLKRIGSFGRSFADLISSKKQSEKREAKLCVEISPFLAK